MRNYFAVVLCCWSLASPAWSASLQPQAAPAASTPAAGEGAPDQVLVVGQKPGPGLWKISKGEHVLWVFGTYAPLPANMAWRSQQVETILAQSQQYLAPPGANASVGILRGLSLLPHVIGITNNPDGKRLRDVVPADVHARWLVLKARYLGANDGIERERPYFAAQKLYGAALKHAGLAGSDQVRNTIEQLVRKNKIKTMYSNVQLEVADPAGAMKAFKKVSMDDVACFTKTIELLETGLDAMRARANAWARGDLAAIRTLGHADRDAACHSAMADSAVLKAQPDWQGAERRVRKLWLEAAEHTLANHRSSFAVLELQTILASGETLAALEAKGYLVEAPE